MTAKTPPREVKLLIKIGPDLRPEITHISLLEDFWHDYCYFKKQAKVAQEEKANFRHKRYLRAALLILIVYLEGVVNKWCTNVLQGHGMSPKEIEKYIRKKDLEAKCKFLTEEATKKNPSVKEPVLDDIKRLRNEIVHFKIDNTLKVFDGLSLAVLLKAEKDMGNWLDTVGSLLGEERHTDTKKLGSKLAQQGNAASEEYSGDT